VYNLIAAVLLSSTTLRVRESTSFDQYVPRARAAPWSEEELEQIRMVLRRLTALRVGNPEDAEDLVQETLLTMVRKAPEVDLEKGLLVWAMGILRKKVGNYYRRAQRTTLIDGRRFVIGEDFHPLAVYPSPESSLQHAELCVMVDDILLTLSPVEREAISLYLAGMETGEIVSRLHPERYQNIVNRLHRGRKKLARELARHGYSEWKAGSPRLPFAARKAVGRSLGRQAVASRRRPGEPLFLERRAHAVGDALQPAGDDQLASGQP
jgi:RNA polymerase sigma factor (sigma-70 family)